MLQRARLHNCLLLLAAEQDAPHGKGCPVIPGRAAAYRLPLSTPDALLVCDVDDCHLVALVRVSRYDPDSDAALVVLERGGLLL